ncbi:MAG TPA: phosphopantetheine-binding protein [Planctomycetota bacterium]|nr:phosphopantetheine-binding protein [Planctomycetota bacterium]
MTREEIFAGVRDCLVSALDVEPGEVREESRIIGDLGADSLDLLDLTFQLEQKFKLSISPRQMERRAREALGNAPLEVDGVYTPAALAEFRKNMPEVPPEELAEGLAAADFPRRLRVATMVNLVRRLLEEKHAGK